MKVNKAIIYIASGKEYIDEAARSVGSTSGYPTVLCTPDTLPTDYYPVHSEILFLPKFDTGYWYLDLVNYLNFAFDQLYPDIDQILLLDTDTYICGDLSDFFTVLDRFDIAGTQAIGRETMVHRDDIPASFPELHVGALVFTRNDAVKLLFKEWLKIYQDSPEYYGNNDQGPLREALWRNTDIKLGILPAEFCFRYRWGGLVNGQVRVLHGRENNTPYEDVAKAVNGNGIRVYGKRELA